VTVRGVQANQPASERVELVAGADELFEPTIDLADALIHELGDVSTGRLATIAHGQDLADVFPGEPGGLHRGPRVAWRTPELYHRTRRRRLEARPP
jgi:hypothetical protein